MCLLNEKQPTYLHSPTGNYYPIDLSICHPNIYSDFELAVCDDLHASDHFPIFIKEIEPYSDEQPCRWNLKKANWEAFTALCQEHCMIPDSWPNRKLIALYSENQLADYENDHEKGANKEIRLW